jgi:DNA recombination protein RmuC
MDILSLIIGVVVGSAVVYVLMQRRVQQQALVLATAQQELEKHRQELGKIDEDLQQVRTQLSDAVKNEAAYRKEVDMLREMYRKLEEERKEVKTELTQAFADISNKGLVEQNKQLTEQQTERLEMLLRPFRDRVMEFQQRVEEGHKAAITQHTSLIEQIKHLTELNTMVSAEAQNLTRALKGDNQQQGAWGEVVLERLLEASGLRSPENYEVQHSTVNEDGQRIRPDAIVHLPDNKHIIIDSKMSLVAFTEFIEAPEGSPDREAALARHMTSLRTHIKQLSEKKYETINLSTPDFVLMFIPVESVFVTTLQTDRGGELYTQALNKRIILVSPSTLLATLRTIASIWKIEMQNKNSEEIARQAGALYDKFVGFVDDLGKIGEQLSRTQKSYDDAYKKLTAGSGNLIGRAEKLRELGVKTTKSLPLSSE